MAVHETGRDRQPGRLHTYTSLTCNLPSCLSSPSTYCLSLPPSLLLSLADLGSFLPSPPTTYHPTHTFARLTHQLLVQTNKTNMFLFCFGLGFVFRSHPSIQVHLIGGESLVGTVLDSSFERWKIRITWLACISQAGHFWASQAFVHAHMQLLHIWLVPACRQTFGKEAWSFRTVLAAMVRQTNTV